jgi:hypothetical protein
VSTSQAVQRCYRLSHWMMHLNAGVSAIQLIEYMSILATEPFVSKHVSLKQTPTGGSISSFSMFKCR